MFTHVVPQAYKAQSPAQRPCRVRTRSDLLLVSTDYFLSFSGDFLEGKCEFHSGVPVWLQK